MSTKYPLNETLSPIDRERRMQLNENWQRITSYFEHVQSQIKILAGGKDLDDVITRLEDAINKANTDVANYILQLDQTVQQAIENNDTATQNAIDANNTATQNAINANNANLQTALQSVTDALTLVDTAISNAETATQEATDAKDSTIQATNDAQSAIIAMNLLINNFVPRGAFAVGTQYYKNNIVRDEEGNSYIARDNNINAGLADTTKWMLFAAKGDKGDRGEKGEQGTGLNILGSLTNISQLPATGDPGDAYTVNGFLYIWSESTDSWENNGNIKGEKGDKGEPGDDGRTAYEVAVSNGFIGTEAEWLASLKGDTPDLRPIENSISNLDEKTNQIAINVKKPPSPLVGAVGNGIVDDAPAIQAIIDYANTNKYDVYIPNGTYRLNSTLKRKGNVSIFGQSMMLTELKFYKTGGGAVIDTVNESLHGVTMQGFKITKDQSVTGNTTGILGGSTLQKYNSAIGSFRDIKIVGLTYGISGNGEPTGVGIFDCLFENIVVSSCFMGIRFHGSGNILTHPRIVLCDTGITFEYLNGESYAGINVIGGVFIQNGYDIGIPNVNGIRPCSFNGTWFEQAASGLINIPYAGTKLMSLSFRDCMLSVTGETWLLNAQNVLGPITIDTCTIAQVGTSSTTINLPTSDDGILKVSNTLKITNDGTRSILNYSKNNNWSKLSLQNGWSDVTESTYTKYFKTDDNIVHLQIGMKDGLVTNATIVGNLPAGYRPSTSVRFFIRDATNSKTVNMYIDPSGNIVISGTDYSTGVWAGYISYRADA